MAPKKKSFLGYSGALLLLLFMLLYENSCMAYEYTEQYDLTEIDIKNIYEHQRDLSFNNAITTGYHYNKIINNWNSCDTAINNVTNWEMLCLTLNVTMRDYFITSGEFFGYNSTEMNDANLWCLVSPASSVQSSTNQLRIHFIPNVSVYPQATEYNNQSGLYKSILTRFYQYNSAGTAVSTNYLSYSTAPVVTLLINNDGTWQIGYRNSNLFSGLHDTGDFYQYASSPSSDSAYLYNMGLLSLYRNQFYTTPNALSYLPYGSSIYLTKVNENRYDLGNHTFGSGEYIPPTPTPQPSSSGDGSVDLTETNALISGIQDTLTDSVNSGDFDLSVISGELSGIADQYAIVDPHASIWGTLVDGLTDALTGDGNPTLSFDLLGKHYDIPVIEKTPFPESLTSFFATMWVVVVALTSLKFWRRILIKLQSGGALEVAHMFSGFDWSNYF